MLPHCATYCCRVSYSLPVRFSVIFVGCCRLVVVGWLLLVDNVKTQKEISVIGNRMIIFVGCCDNSNCCDYCSWPWRIFLLDSTTHVLLNQPIFLYGCYRCGVSIRFQSDAKYHSSRDFRVRGESARCRKRLLVKPKHQDGENKNAITTGGDETGSCSDTSCWKGETQPTVHTSPPQQKKKYQL